jgi:hypothetical protein
MKQEMGEVENTLRIAENKKREPMQTGGEGE